MKTLEVKFLLEGNITLTSGVVEIPEEEQADAQPLLELFQEMGRNLHTDSEYDTFQMKVESTGTETYFNKNKILAIQIITDQGEQ